MISLPKGVLIDQLIKDLKEIAWKADNIFTYYTNVLKTSEALEESMSFILAVEIGKVSSNYVNYLRIRFQLHHLTFKMKQKYFKKNSLVM